MPFTVDHVVPWGRSYDEYVRMFALSDDDLALRILGCGDGPAAFNAELTRRGGTVVSVDPIYAVSGDEIRRRIDENYDQMLEETRRNQDEFVWNVIPSLNALARMRSEAMNAFLDDYSAGLDAGRYIEGKLPKLDFPDGAFDLALCSHFLFLYSAQFSEDFHVESIRELCRVATEVRIFPLLEFGALPSRHLQRVIGRFSADDYHAEVVPVPYEFQRGGDLMLRARRAA